MWILEWMEINLGLLLHLRVSISGEARMCSVWMVWDEQGSEKDLKSIVVFFMLRSPWSELQHSF